MGRSVMLKWTTRSDPRRSLGDRFLAVSLEARKSGVGLSC
jgi:hypothetical protein